MASGRKTATYGARGDVIYSPERWQILEKKRDRAKEIMRRLERRSIPSIVYGSVARGDVVPDSDVDIFIPVKVPSFLIEISLEGLNVLQRRVVQATPNYAIKGEITLDDDTTLSFPLVNLKDREIDFYTFGGAINLSELKNNKRVAGVDKRLVLIMPNEKGHSEIPINEMDEAELSKILGVGIDIILERKRVLERRREVGRTGVFMCETVPDAESFESFIREMAKRNPAVRRRLGEVK
jgi:hypothetical protein